jgi:ATP-binding cassette, subfamily B, multidrug efflux pump
VLIRLFRSHLVGRYRSLLILLLILQIVQAGCSLLLPAINAKVIDNGVLTGNTSYIWRMGGVMLGVAAVQMAFAIGAMYVSARAAMGFGRDIRSDLFHRVTSFSQREVNQLGAPSLITRITNDVQQVQLLGVMVCSMAITAPIMALGGIFMAMREDLGLSALLLVSLPILVVILWVMISRMIPTFRLMQERIDGVNRVMREQIIGIRVVRAFVREPEETARFDVVNGELTDTSLKAGRLMALMFPVVMLVVNCSSVAVIWFGAPRIQDGSLTIGAMVAFLSYFTIILMSLMMASFVMMMAPRAAVSADRIVEILDTDTSVTIADEPIAELHTSGTLELRDVSFGYPGAEAPVLQGISFTSRPGEMTAIIGSTGSGKSTLVNLIPRLVDVTAGSVLVDGVDVRQLDPEMLWRRVGLVPQKPYLFTGTVASNLRYGREDATDDEMWAALEVAQAAGFVREMGGLEARIAQGGGNVSGGQRQRLSIARAVVRKPEIYVFDDSFSALDLATDARLRAALVPWTRDATVVVVAQRVSTIINADQIIVLEDGEMVGVGTHSELLESCPTYAEIVASQNKQQQEAA